MEMKGMKKHVWLMMTVWLVCFMMVACNKSQARDEIVGDQSASAKAELEKSDTDPYELVSTEWVTSQASNSASQQTAYWNENQPDGGLLLVLKLKGNDSKVYYSSDFSLGYDDEAGIPRSACLGISMGVMQADQVTQSSWMLGGAMSRCWASKEKPFFGVLFSVPRTIKQVTLYLAQLSMKDIGLKPVGDNK